MCYPYLHFHFRGQILLWDGPCKNLSSKKFNGSKGSDFIHVSDKDNERIVLHNVEAFLSTNQLELVDFSAELSNSLCQYHFRAKVKETYSLQVTQNRDQYVFTYRAQFRRNVRPVRYPRWHFLYRTLTWLSNRAFREKISLVSINCIGSGLNDASQFTVWLSEAESFLKL